MITFTTLPLFENEEQIRVNIGNCEKWLYKDANTYSIHLLTTSGANKQESQQHLS